MNRVRLLAGAVLAPAVLVLATPASTLAAPTPTDGRPTATTHRVSEAPDGAGGNSYSSFLRLSADGRYAAFASTASNLVPGDLDGTLDVFRRNLRTGETVRVSVPMPGSPAERYGASDFPAISADGRYVAFYSNASNLVPGDTNGANDIFVRDVTAGTTTRVNVSSAGEQAAGWSWDPVISGDGRYVAFIAPSSLVPGGNPNFSDVFVHDRRHGTTTRVSAAPDGSRANADSFNPDISADGRYVAFVSSAANLVPGDTNGQHDIFVRDLRTGAVVEASRADTGRQSDAGSQRPALSRDGRYVAFQSEATNLAPGDTNGTSDIYRRDLRAERTERISVSTAGTQSSGYSSRPAISGDGRYVAFETFGADLLPGPAAATWHILLRDVRAGHTVAASVSGTGEPGNDSSWNPDLSADGRRVGFQSYASNLVPADDPGTSDVFVHVRR